MDLIDIFSNSEINDIAAVINCILNRIPIIIKGKKEIDVEDFINELYSLISFRNPIIFYTDFIDLKQYHQIIENEEIDFQIERNIFICYPFAVEKFLDLFDDPKSWIIGISEEMMENGFLLKIRSKMNYLKEKYLEIQLLDNKIKIEFRNDLKITNLSLERNLYENAIMRTEIAVEKMRRVISKRLKKVNLDTELMDDLLNFSIEEKDIKENLLKREIIDLYEASKRAFSLLNRMDNLNDFGINTKMSAKTLFNTIAYEDLLSESRLLEFIEAEWNMDYQKFFESNKISKFMDKIESLWG